MKLTVLGCSGTFAGPASGCSAYLVEHEGFRLLVDVGYAAVGALQRHGALFDVDAVVVTHLHADHCIDLVGYAYARHYHPAGCPPRLPVYGPAGTRERIAAAIALTPTPWLDEVYDWHPLTGECLQIGPYAVTPELMAHPVECYGLRLEAGGRSLVYSADTGPCPQLAGLARGADVFLCEASFVEGQNPPNLHLTGREAGSAAQQAGVGSLLLTHLVSWHDEAVVLGEAQQAFAGDLRLARDGLRYPV